ncbi:P-loop containing nucleoside triphosphate hydrolase protein [Morchella snyderi]|nr:P-loop containing nucleoside triphosphate hydrolase protein [Morchella snyderi]
MSDLHTLLPAYTPPSPPAADLLAALATAHIPTTDLLTQDALALSRRLATTTTRASVLDIKLLTRSVAAALHADTAAATPPPQFLTTADAALDALLGGGIRTCCITEFVGESGAGKSQFLLPLLLTSQLPPALGGLARPSVYISTEAPLSTPRLSQLLRAAPERYPGASLDRVYTITCSDLEAQEHVLRYQLPVLVARHGVGVVVVDSVAANFRDGRGGGGAAAAAGRAQRGGELVRMAEVLRGVAVGAGVAVVVANQVADWFGGGGGGGGGGELGLDVQARWFNGWEEEEEAQERDGGGGGGGGTAKVPSLGMVWACLLAARVVVKRVGVDGAWRRTVRVVFAPWAAGSGREMVFEVWAGGVRAVVEPAPSL